MRITLLGLLLIGCGGDDDGTAFEGIWRADTWTENTMGCTEGPSVLATRDAFFYTKNESFLGQSFVNVKGCDDIATCKMEANDDDTINIGMFGFDEGSDGAGWTVHNVSGFSFQGQCEGSVGDGKLTISATTWRIEGRTVDVAPFPAGTGDEPCPEDKVEKAAEGQPCTQLEVVTATFMEAF